MKKAVASFLALLLSLCAVAPSVAFAEDVDVAGDPIRECEEPGLSLMYVTGNRVRERTEPNTTSKVVAHHSVGEVLEVVEIVDGWALLANGHYFSAEYLSATRDDPDTAAKIAEYVAKYDDIIITVLHEQYVRYYQNGEIIVEGDCVTGKDSTPTDLGFFTVYQKRKTFNMNGNPATYVERFTVYNNGEGFHDAHWRSAFGASVNYRSSGSHGCTNCPDELSNAIYEHATVGQTRVLVLP